MHLGNRRSERSVDFRSISYQRYSEPRIIDYAVAIKAYERRIAGRVRISSDWCCLELACGFGKFLAFLRFLGVSELVGVDSSLACINVAGAEFGKEHVVCADIFEFLEDTKERFDFVCGLDIIEHLRKDELFKLFGLVKRVQKGEKLLLLRTPNANGLFGMAARYNDITHEVCFTPDAIRDVLARGGYQVVDIWEDGPAWGSFLQTAHWLAWSFVKFLIRIVNAAETGGWGDGILTRNMWVLAKGFVDNQKLS